LFNIGFFQHVDKFVEAEAVADSRKAVYFKVRTGDEEVGVEQRRGAAGPDEDTGIEYEFGGGRRAVKNEKEENKENLGTFEIFPEDESVPQGKPRRRIAQNDPYEVEAAPVKMIVLRQVKIETQGQVEKEDCRMDAGDEAAAPFDEPCPPFVPVGKVIGKDKDAVAGMDLEDIEHGGIDGEKNTHFPARYSPQKVIGVIADQRDKGANQHAEKKAPLKTVGVVFTKIINENQDEKKAGTQ
jgi:hypothetical protein